MIHRVLHVIPSLRWSPEQRQLRIVLKHGDPAFLHQVCVLRDEPPQECWETGAHVQHLGFANRLDLVGCRKLRTAIRNFSPQVVHAWSPATFGAVRIAAAGLRCRLIGSEFACCATRAVQALASGLIPQPDWWMGHRRIIPSWCRDAPSQPSRGRNIVHMDYGVELINESDQRRDACHRICQPLGIPAESKLVGFLGEFDVRQRLKDAIWAADLIKVVRDDVHLLLAGSGPHLPRLTRFRQQVRIGDRVHFVHDPSLFDATLSALDVCWVTGESDLGTPLLVEAMARGVPVIASDTPSHREFVRPDVTGLLFEVGHRAGLARWTHKLLEDASRADRLRQSARAQLAATCTTAKVAAAYAQIYG